MGWCKKCTWTDRLRKDYGGFWSPEERFRLSSEKQHHSPIELVYYLIPSWHLLLSRPELMQVLLRVVHKTDIKIEIWECPHIKRATPWIIPWYKTAAQENVSVEENKLAGQWFRQAWNPIEHGIQPGDSLHSKWGVRVNPKACGHGIHQFTSPCPKQPALHKIETTFYRYTFSANSPTMIWKN